MRQFATEFPVKPSFTRAKFASLVVTWLQGTSYSDLLVAANSERRLEADTADLISASGEQLLLREIADESGLRAIGIRHDNPDGLGRLWRTEAVLKKTAAAEPGLVRIRTQCTATEPGVRLEFPKKPYLVKLLLNEAIAGIDGDIEIGDTAIRLAENDNDLAYARDLTFGSASVHLPVMYVSAETGTGCSLSDAQIDKLAFDLGGVCHVVVEPSRAFSFRLRDATAGSNAYGGSIGLALPERGLVTRLTLGWKFEDSFELQSAARVAAIALRSQMPARGWDWSELQEQAIQRQRERDHNRLTMEEVETLYQAEITALKDRNQQLDQQLAEANARARERDLQDSMFPKSLVDHLGPELYAGEYWDRLRLATDIALRGAETIGLDKRSRTIFETVSARLRPTPELAELKHDLRRATRDRNRVARELPALMHRHGYTLSSQNSHIRLEPRPGYLGLDKLTVPTTPGEIRGLDNLRKQIERTLGVTNL